MLYVTVTVNNFYPLWVGGSVLQWPALVNTRNVKYWAATFYVSADLCSAGSGVRCPGDVTNGDTGPDRCQQSSHPPVHALEAAAGRGHNINRRADSCSDVTELHCIVTVDCIVGQPADGGWKHHNCVKLTVATMTFRCEMTSELNQEDFYIFTSSTLYHIYSYLSAKHTWKS